VHDICPAALKNPAQTPIASSQFRSFFTLVIPFKGKVVVVRDNGYESKQTTADSED